MAVENVIMNTPNCVLQEVWVFSWILTVFPLLATLNVLLVLTSTYVHYATPDIILTVLQKNVNLAQEIVSSAPAQPVVPYAVGDLWPLPMGHAEGALYPAGTAWPRISLNALPVLSDWNCKGISASSVLPTAKYATKATARYVPRDTRQKLGPARSTASFPAQHAYKASLRPAYHVLAQTFSMEPLVSSTYPAMLLPIVSTAGRFMDYTCSNSTAIHAAL